MVSMPKGNEGSAIGNSRATEKALMDYAGELGKTLGVQHIEFRDTYERQQSWPIRTDKVAMILD